MVARAVFIPKLPRLKVPALGDFTRLPLVFLDRSQNHVSKLPLGLQPTVGSRSHLCSRVVVLLQRFCEPLQFVSRLSLVFDLLTTH